MSHIRKHLQKEHFDDIVLGSKTVEGRLKKGDFSSLQPGHIITFHNDDGNEVVVTVINVIPYDSFSDFLNNHLHSALPRVLSKKEGLDIYLKPTGIYEPEDETRYKVVAVVFQKFLGYQTPVFSRTLPSIFNS